MSKNWTVGVGLLALALVVGLVFAFYPGRSAVGAADQAAGARYTVVATDGAHIIVTDNGTNKIYFYAIDKDGKVGDELKLRGSLDLSNVGKPSLKPIDAKPQK
jgi:hypothetical protein